MVTTIDHKRLAILYILFALAFLATGGIEATVMRFQLIRPLNDFVSPQLFNWNGAQVGRLRPAGPLA